MFYESIFKGISNIYVNHEGPVNSWILASKVVIHDGCTTAIETSLSEKTIINFKPIYDESTDIWLPNQMGIKVSTITEVENILNNIFKKKSQMCSVQNEEKVKDLMFNFGNDSYQALLDVINNALTQLEIKKSKSPTNLFINRSYIETKLKKDLYSLKSKRSKENVNYHNRKFYGFDNNYIKERFEILEKLLNKKIKYTYHNPYLIEVK